jgi:preprotein translocase subunit SecG
MITLITIIHVMVCVMLIMIVLLQTGKGADIGAVFGGGAGSQALFGSAGPAGFLAKVTTVIAAIFMITSLYLAYASGIKGTTQTIMEETKPRATQEMPAPVPEKQVPSEKGGGEEK